MAKYVVSGSKVTLNGTDISSSVARAELVINAADVVTTDLGSNGWETRIGGLKSGEVSLDFHSDLGAGGVNSLLSPLVGSLATVTISANPSSTAISSTNPLWTALVLVNSFTPVAGAVGDLATFSVTFPTSGSVTSSTAA